MIKKTQLQWVKDGYILNEDAKGIIEWNNGYHVFMVTRYYENEVHENPEEAKKFLKEKRKKLTRKEKSVKKNY